MIMVKEYYYPNYQQAIGAQKHAKTAGCKAKTVKLADGRYKLEVTTQK